MTRTDSVILNHPDAASATRASTTAAKRNGKTVDIKPLKLAVREAAKEAKATERTLVKAQKAHAKATERYNAASVKLSALQEKHSQGRGKRLPEAVKEKLTLGKTQLGELRNARKAARLEATSAEREFKAASRVLVKAEKALAKVS